MQVQYTLTDKEIAVIDALEDLGKHIMAIEFAKNYSGIGTYSVKLHYSEVEGGQEIVIDITDVSNW